MKTFWPSLQPTEVQNENGTGPHTEMQRVACDIAPLTRPETQATLVA